jgi:dihydrofolate reductase
MSILEAKRKLLLYIAASLDGYIATEDDSLEWLFNVEGEGDNGYSEFLSTVDTILLGRRTYDWVMNMEKGNFPYKNQKCYVFSNSMQGKDENVEFVKEDVVDFTNKLKATEGGDIWIVGGSKLLGAFIKAKLVDEMIINIAPVLIGRGIPLFSQMDIELKYELKGIRRFNQFAELHYELK